LNLERKRKGEAERGSSRGRAVPGSPRTGSLRTEGSRFRKAEVPERNVSDIGEVRKGNRETEIWEGSRKGILIMRGSARNRQD
jgi:hypothetical protein